MSKTEVREQDIYFQMESINETEAGSSDHIADESGTSARKQMVEKFPQGAGKEGKLSKEHKNACRSHTLIFRSLVFISTFAVVVAFLVAVVCLTLTLTLMSRNNSTPSKNCAVVNGK